MIASLLNPVAKEKNVEEVKGSAASQLLRKRLKKLARPKKAMSDRVQAVRSLLKVNKDGDKPDSKKDLTPDSSDHDKTWKPPKKDPPGSSDDFKEELMRGKNKTGFRPVS